MYPGADPIPLCFRPTGGYIAPRAGLDTCWGIEHGTPDPAKLVTVALLPLPQGVLVGRGDYRAPDLSDVRDAAMADARELASWYWDPDTERTWRTGSPTPAPVPDDSPVEMLSARARRSVTRAISNSLDQLPAAVLADGIVMSFTTDGVPAGLAFTPFPPEKHIQVTLTADSDPADIPAFLDRVRICPSGRVEVLAPS